MATDLVAQTDPLFELEARVLSEKAKGLSDLEVASKLLLYESTVRVIVGQHKVRLRSRGNSRGPLSMDEPWYEILTTSAPRLTIGRE